MAGIERNASSMALGLHCLCIRVAGSSFLFLDERGVIARTSPKRICRFLMSPTGASAVPTIATSLPVPMGLTLWWCASLASRLKTSVWPRLGCRNAKASRPPFTLQCPNSLPLKRNSIHCLPWLTDWACTLHRKSCLIVAFIGAEHWQIVIQHVDSHG